MFEENDDIENELSNDNDFDEEDATDIMNIDDEENPITADEGFKLVTFKNILENIAKTPKKTIPFLTKYEKTKILGQRAKQINNGAKIFVKSSENIIDGYLIAIMELEQKRIPFIIRRPVPGGGCEYWKVADLENIAF